MDLESKIFTPNGRKLEFDIDTFGLEIKTYRLRHGWTQAQLGKQWGLSRYSIIRAEHGKNISWENAYKLFAFLAKALREEGRDK